MSLQRDAEGMAFPDDFTDIPAASLEAVIMDELAKGQWEPEEYALCETAFEADRRSEVLIDGEPSVSSQYDWNLDNPARY